MASYPLQPLSDTDYENINKQLRELEALRQEIGKAAAAGCATGEHGPHCDHLIQQLTALKRVYFPERP